MNNYNVNIKESLLSDQILIQESVGFALTPEHFDTIRSIINQYNFGKAIEAEDVIQEFLLKLMNYHLLQTQLFSDSNVIPYLKRITHSFCIDTYRYEKRRINQNIDLPEYFNSILIDGDIYGEVEIDFGIVSQLLPKKLRQVVELKRKGYRHNEIANKLNIDVPTSRKRLQRAREKLRKEFRHELSN